MGGHRDAHHGDQQRQRVGHSDRHRFVHTQDQPHYRDLGELPGAASQCCDRQHAPTRHGRHQRRSPEARCGGVDTQLRAARRGTRPNPLARTRPGLLRPQEGRGQEALGGDALPQTPAVRRRLPRPATRPQQQARGGGPGRTPGGDTSLQRDWPNPDSQLIGSVTHRTRHSRPYAPPDDGQDRPLSTEGSASVHSCFPCVRLPPRV